MKKRYIDFVPAKNKKPTNGGNVKVASKKVTVSKKVDASKGSDTLKKADGLKKADAPKKTDIPKKMPKKPPVNPLVEDDVDVEKIFAERKQPAGVSRNGAKFGVIEDYQPKFVRAEVEKRPLGHQEKKKVEEEMEEAEDEAKSTKSAKNDMAKVNNVKTSSAKSSGAKSIAVKSTSVKPKATASSVPAKPVRSVARPAARPAARPVSRPVPRPGAVNGVRKTAFVNTSKIEKRPLSGSAYIKRPVVVPEEKPSKPVKIIEKPEKDSKAGLIIAIILTIILGAAAGTVAFLLLPK